jgi:multiple sugar transport system substrate-binding protein
MATQIGAFEVERAVNRRGFLRASAGGLAGVAAVLALRQPPAMAQARELNVLSWNHFVPASDDKLREQAEAFSKQRGVKVRVDTIAHLQIPSKLAAKAQTQSGHDIVILGRSAPGSVCGRTAGNVFGLS